MPETSFLRSWMIIELAADIINGFFVFFFTCDVVQHHHNLTIVGMIYIELISFIIFYRAVFPYIIIHAVLNIVKVRSVAIQFPDAFNAFQYHALVVTPACRVTGFNSK